MAFEFRTFTEEDKQKYDSLNLKNPLSTFLYPSYWSIDEERQALMVEFGGRGNLDPKYGEPPDFFALVWKKHIVALEGHYKTTYPTKHTKEMWYEMTRVVMPKELEDRIDMVIAMVCEAIQVLRAGTGYRPQAVHVEFIKIYYV